MGLLEKEVAPAVVAHPGTWPTAKGETLWTPKVYAPQPLKFSPMRYPTACYEGFVYSRTHR
jgi:hypothetical protein